MKDKFYLYLENEERSCKSLISGDIWGTWVAQSVRQPTLGFDSGHDLTVHEIEPHVGLHTGSVEPPWDSLSPSLSLSLPLLHLLSLSLSQNK